MLSISSTLAVGVLIGAPATATGQAVGSDSVTGGARECIPFPEPFPGQEPCERTLVLNVDVDSGPAGEIPAGTVTWDDLGITPGGTTRSETTATCLAVTGHVAIIGVTGTWQRFGATGFQLQIAGLVRVVDGGGPNSGADTFQSAITTGPEGGPALPDRPAARLSPGDFLSALSRPFSFRASRTKQATSSWPTPDASRHRRTNARTAAGEPSGCSKTRATASASWRRRARTSRPTSRASPGSCRRG